MRVMAVQLDNESVASFVDEKKAANIVRKTRTQWRSQGGLGGQLPPFFQEERHKNLRY